MMGPSKAAQCPSIMEAENVVVIPLTVQNSETLIVEWLAWNIYAREKNTGKYFVTAVKQICLSAKIKSVVPKVTHCIDSHPVFCTLSA